MVSNVQVSFLKEQKKEKGTEVARQGRWKAKHECGLNGSLLLASSPLGAQSTYWITELAPTWGRATCLLYSPYGPVIGLLSQQRGTVCVVLSYFSETLKKKEESRSSALEERSLKKSFRRWPDFSGKWFQAWRHFNSLLVTSLIPSLLGWLLAMGQWRGLAKCASAVRFAFWDPIVG